MVTYDLDIDEPTESCGTVEGRLNASFHVEGGVNANSSSTPQCPPCCDFATCELSTKQHELAVLIFRDAVNPSRDSTPGDCVGSFPVLALGLLLR